MHTRSNKKQKSAISLCKVKLVGTVAALMLPLASLASDPNTSIRSWVEYPYMNTSDNLILGATSSYVNVSAVASSDRYALLGSAWPRLETWITCTGFPIGCGGLTSGALFESNPVHVVGPWDGSVSATLTIEAPTHALGVKEFGSALSMQGTRIAVGAPSVFSWSHDVDPETYAISVDTETTGGGAVHLYQINGTAISAERTIAYGGLQERFGTALDMDAVHLLVGRPGAIPGAADLFNPKTGDHIASLVSPGIDDGFAHAVALAGDLAIVAAPEADTVYVYRHDGSGNWPAAGVLDSPGAGSEFGFSLDADGERIIVGAPGIDRAYIYEDDGDSNWPVTAELAGASTSRLGASVAITGEVAFAAAPRLLIGSSRVGFVARHERLDGSWPFVGSTLAQPARDGDNYGTRISASTGMLTALEPGSSEDLPDKLNIHTGPGKIWDTDNDGVVQFLDNCLNVANTNQADFDADGLGNACDPDGDNDGLSNQNEVIAGTDLFNPDTDGDGMLDGEDPEPLVSDLDADGLSDGEEIAAGTDPMNPDTDDDGQNDGDDPYPLDPNDGWLLYERLDIDHAELALGTDVLLIRKSNGDVEAKTRVAEQWVTIPAPALQGSPMPAIARMQMKGTRAVFVQDNPANPYNLRYLFHVFDYDEASGWTWLGTGNTAAAQGAFNSITDIAVDGDIVAAMVTAAGNTTTLIFKVEPTGIASIAQRPTATGKVSVSGTTVAVGTSGAYGGEGAVVVMSAANNYVPQEVRRAPGMRGSGQYVGQDISPADANEFLVGSEAGGFWLKNSGGNWQLTQLGIPPPIIWSSRDYWLGGGGRRVVMHGLIDWFAYRGADKSLLGKLRGTVSSSDRPLTNGELVVHGSRPSGQDYIEIYHTGITQPPGC